jgi:ribosomal protein S18 acetylase RimI-like enzyme
LAVIPEYRRTGLAQMLIQAAENRLREIGIEIFACLIEAENKASEFLDVEFGMLLGKELDRSFNQ